MPHTRPIRPSPSPCHTHTTGAWPGVRTREPRPDADHVIHGVRGAGGATVNPGGAAQGKGARCGHHRIWRKTSTVEGERNRGDKDPFPGYGRDTDGIGSVRRTRVRMPGGVGWRERDDSRHQSRCREVKVGWTWHVRASWIGSTVRTYEWWVQQDSKHSDPRTVGKPRSNDTMEISCVRASTRGGSGRSRVPPH